MNRIDNNFKKSNKKQSENIVHQKQKKNKKKTIKGKLKRLLLLIILIVIILSIIFGLKVKENGGGIKGVLTTVLGLNIEEVNNLDTINVLLLGISEDLDSKLTDTIIMCSYNPQNKKVYMLSIPRDTFIGNNKSKAKGTDKINSLYSKNPQKLLDTVSKITGIEVKYYAVVNNEALIEIVDEIGGVIFEVPINMDYDDPTQDLHIHLKEGLQKIDGQKAEQLLRFRHNNNGTSYPVEYGDNDFGRMKTQRNFMLEIVRQLIKFKNIKKSKKILNTVFDNVETNLKIDDLKPYIPLITEFDINNIISKQLPGQSEKCNNLWFFIYDVGETKNLIDKLLEINK